MFLSGTSLVRLAVRPCADEWRKMVSAAGGLPAPHNAPRQSASQVRGVLREVRGGEVARGERTRRRDGGSEGLVSLLALRRAGGIAVAVSVTAGGFLLTHFFPVGQ